MSSTSCAPTHIRIAAASEADLQEALNRYQQLVSKVIVVILVKSVESHNGGDVQSPTASSIIKDCGDGSVGAITVAIKSPSSITLRLRGRYANPLKDEITRQIFGDNQSESRVDLLAVTARMNERDNQSDDPVGIVLCADWPSADAQKRAIECLLDSIRLICDPDHLNHSAVEVIPYHMFCYPMLKYYIASGLGKNTVEATPLMETLPTVYETWAPNAGTSCAPTHIRIAAASEADLQEALNRYQQLISKVIVVLLVKPESQNTVTSPPYAAVSFAGAAPMVKSLEVKDPNFIAWRMVGYKGNVTNSFKDALSRQIFEGCGSRVELEILTGNDSGENSSNVNEGPVGLGTVAEWPKADSQKWALEYISDTIEYVSDAEEKVRIETLDVNDMLERGIERLIVIGDVHDTHTIKTKLHQSLISDVFSLFEQTSQVW